MYKSILFLLFIGLISSCKESKDEADTTSRLLTPDTETTNICAYQKASKEDLVQFFEIKNNVDSLNELFFFENDDSVIWYDENKSDWIVPLRRIGVAEQELQKSKLVIQKTFSVLILVNPAETLFALFYKQNGKKVDRMIENQHYADSVIFHELNDTLLVCEYYCKYDFGSALSDIRTYYFIGEKTGFFKSVCTTVGEKLKIENFVLKDDAHKLRLNEPDARIFISPDTLKQLGSSKKEIAFKPSYLYFENVVLQKLN